MKKLLLLFSLLTIQLAYSQIPTTGLTSAYLFNNKSMKDGVAGGSDLTQVGTALTAIANHGGGASRAIKLNGDHLQRTGIAGNTLSASFWIKTNTNDATKRVIIDQSERATEAEGAAETGWYAYLTNGKIAVAGNFEYYHWNNTAAGASGYSGYAYLEPTTVISDDNWHHVAITITGFAGSWLNAPYQRYDNIIRVTYAIYIDNVLVKTQEQVRNIGTATHPTLRRFVNAAFPITIANSKGGNSTNRFQDAIDDVRFYSTALSVAEVGNLYGETVCAGSTAATAKAKNISVKLNAEGTATVLPSAVNDGSVDSCGDPITNLSLNTSSFTCADIGAKTVTLTATDLEGNTSTATATITVTPLITVKTKSTTVIIDLDATGNAVLAPKDVDDGTTSSCTPPVTLSLSRTGFSCTDAGTNIVVTLTATDSNGNTETGTATVRAEDRVLPTAKAKDISVQLDLATGKTTITPQMIDDGSTDNCLATLSLSKTTFTCADLGVNKVILTVTDNRSNVRRDTAKVTVTSAIKQETVTVANASFCTDGTTGTIVSTGSSVVGVNYYLRNSKNDSIVAGPVAGTGSGLTFNTGNISKTTTYNVLAQLLAPGSGALDFDGTNDYISANPGFSYEAGYTFEAWVKAPLPGATISRPIFHIGTTTKSDIEVYMQQSSNKLVVVHNRGNIGMGGYGYPTPPINTWYHLAVTYSGGSDIKVYYNGIQQATQNINTVAPGALLKTTGAGLRIGNVSNTVFPAGSNFQGQMDDVRFWSKVKTSAEILAQKDNCIAGTETGLAIYYNFDDGIGTRAKDLVGSNDGTLVNMDAVDWVKGTLDCGGGTCSVKMATEVTVGDIVKPVAVAKNITINQDAPGKIQISASQINNGSTDNCTSAEKLIYSLNKSTFECGEMGANTVILTVTDQSGNSDTAKAVVTIATSIQDQAVTSAATAMCPGDSTTISIAASQDKFTYYLRNEANEQIGKPIVGTGEALSFKTGSISKTSTFHIYAEQPLLKDDAMSVAGSSGYVSIPSTPSLRLAQNWTLEAWVLPNGISQNIIETYDNNGGFVLRSNQNGNWQAYAMFSGANSSTVISKAKAVTQKWVHIAATFNETSNELKIYVNGVLDTVNVAATVDQRGSLAPIKLGARGDDAQIQSAHSQDEIRIWNVERTAKEIADNMTKSVSADAAGLVAYYDFNNLTFSASEMAIPDKTSNANHGVIVGAYSSSNFVSGPFADQSLWCGSVMSTKITVTAEDLLAPTALAQNLSIYLEENNLATVTADMINLGSSDNCSAVTLKLSLPNATTESPEGIQFTGDNIGANEVVLEVSDASGNKSTANATVTVNAFKPTQTITFASLEGFTYGAADLTLSATSSSALPVTFEIVSGTATLTDNVLSFTKAGTIVIAAKQAGNDDFRPAQSVEQTIVVNKAPLLVEADNKIITYGEAFPELTYSISGFVNGESEADLSSTISVQISEKFEGPANVGTYAITLDISMSDENGGDNYTFEQANATLTINQADQVITISPIGSKQVNDPAFEVEVTVDSGLELSMEISGPASLSGSTITLTGLPGTVTLSASQAGNSNYHAATAQLSFIVAPILGLGTLKEQLRIYPNPVSEYLVIESVELMNLRFIGMDGRVVKTIDQIKGRIDLEELPEGIYLLEVSNQKQKLVVRIQKAN